MENINTNEVNVLRMADFHQEVLGKHCRICGKASCAERSDELERTFGTPADVHLLLRLLQHSGERKKGQGRKQAVHSELFSWNPHCTVLLCVTTSS